MPRNPYEFEQKVKAYIKRCGWAQAETARRLNYSPEQFNKWLRDVNRIPDTAIAELSDLFDLVPEELAGIIRFGRL
ncbi:MAG TPA: helix-turn-helix transcriptional regulator [Anaerolineae bacterium]|nr:helix-turn-helix transcriptional regulator [Anaerolineales bacterium]HRV92450.1 helix-turn-helix transcriptional regulator [Anaerolineae bacterium]